MVAFGTDLSLDPYSPLHSPQHRGYPDASSRPVTATEGETLPDLPVTAVATGEAHCEMRLRERIAQLEGELDRRANIITTLADGGLTLDEVKALLNGRPYADALRRIARVRLNMPDQHLARAALGLPLDADDARAALRECANS